MKRMLKILLVMIAAGGMSGYARTPDGEAIAALPARQPALVARAEASAPARAAESREPSEWTLILCGFVVVGFIARRKSRLVAA